MLVRSWQLIGRHWGVIAAFAAVGLVLGIGLSFLRPLEYRSSVGLLITQDTISADAYTASRSAERLADDLAKIVYKTTFFDQVMNANFNIDMSQFPNEVTQASKRRKVWSRMMSTTVTRGTGLLGIHVYNRDPEQARQISQAVAFVLTQQGWRYTSGGDISVRLVDEPLVSRFPVRPNIPSNAVVGLILGGLTGAVYVVVKAEQRRRRRKFIGA